jgi:hypothetical protein
MHSSSLVPTQLISKISNLAASNLELAQFLRSVGALVMDSTDAGTLVITLRNAKTGGVEQYAETRRHDRKDQPATASAQAFFSRPIVLRGVRYGHLELRASGLHIGTESLQSVVEVLTAQLGALAELEVERARQAKLTSEHEAAAWQLKMEKTLARAAGIMAQSDNLDRGEALARLRAESLGSRLPLWRLAENLIRDYEARKAAQGIRIGPPLRRIA